MKTHRILFLFVLLLSFQYIISQRPKVGLTLSGGGAKGLAHIGILKAIDKAGLKVDYITGTSMGSIIGAMYAVGYSGDQIETIAGGLDWTKLLSGKPMYYDVSLDEKDDYENYSAIIPFKDFKPKLSTGLIESEEIWLRFSEIFFPVHDVKDFSKFNIPFKCIATDLSNGKAVVLDSGEVVKAIRASMAIPGVFAAVPYKDTKLVDGGIVRNFPVKDVAEMGGEYRIGVSVASDLLQADELNSVLGVLFQVAFFKDADDFVEEKKLCHKFIAPPLGNYNAGSFGAANEIIEIGNEMGEKMYPYFKHLADSLNDIEHIAFDANNRLPNKKTVKIDRIDIEGLEKTSKSMLVRNLDIHEGEIYTPYELNAGFRRAYSLLLYKYVYYEIQPTTEGHAVLKCIVKENELDYLTLGLSYHSFTNAAIQMNYTWRNLVFDKSRTNIKMAISENWRFNIQHRQYLGKKLSHALDASFRGDRLDIPIYSGANLIDLNKGKILNGDLFYHRFFNNHFGLGVGVGRRHVFFNQTVSTNDVKKGQVSQTNATFRLKYNSLDRRFLPRTGIETIFEAQLSGNRYYKNVLIAEDGSDSIVAKYIHEPLFGIRFTRNGFHAVNQRLSILENVNIAFAENSNELVFDEFVLGGVQRLVDSQIPFIGLLEGQIYSHSVASVGLGAQYNLFGEFYTILQANIAGYDYSNPLKSDFLDEVKYVSGGGCSVAYNLSALPMRFTIMYSPQIDKLYSHVNIGFVF